MLDFTVYMHNYYELDNIVIIIIMTDHLNMSMSDIRRNHFHLGGGAAESVSSGVVHQYFIIRKFRRDYLFV